MGRGAWVGLTREASEERFSGFWPRNRASAKTKKIELAGRGGGRKETLADRPRDFENFRSPTNEGF